MKETPKDKTTIKISKKTHQRLKTAGVKLSYMSGSNEYMTVDRVISGLIDMLDASVKAKESK